MKATVFVPRQIHIPDSELPRLAGLAARARRNRKANQPVRDFPIRAEEIIEQAVRLGLVKLGEYATGDDERIWYRGKLQSRDVFYDELKSRNKRTK